MKNNRISKIINTIGALMKRRIEFYLVPDLKKYNVIWGIMQDDSINTVIDSS
jgi:hypothetical protein